MLAHIVPGDGDSGLARIGPLTASAWFTGHVDPRRGSTRLAHHAAGIAPDGHLLAFLMIGYDATGVRQHSSLLAGDVRAHVPRVSLRNECRVGHFVMVLDPIVLRLLGRLDLGQAASLHVAYAA